MIEYIENEKHYFAVIEGIFESARSKLDIATANLKDIIIVSGKQSESLIDYFLRKVDAGLEIRVLHGGVPSEWFLREAKKAGLLGRKNFSMRRCPRVHQKTFLADGRILYIGSANLTGAGIGAKSEKNRNFEVGIITDERDFIDRADSLFELIWCGDMCRDCGRKKSCPIPLEEN